MTLSTTFKDLRQRLLQGRQRLLVWVAGERQWCHDQLNGELVDYLVGRGVLISDVALAGCQPLNARQAPTVLGQTLDFAVFDAFSGFNPNAFGQVAGAIQAGGCLVLLTPAADAWPDFPDPEYASLCVEPYRPEQLSGQYLGHLVRVLDQAQTLVRWHQCQAPRIPETLPPIEPAESVPPPCLSADQAEAVALIQHTAAARAQPLILSADRGRGKSAALGLAAAALLEQGVRVVLTAVSKSAVASVLERVQVMAPELADQLIFLRPDELLQARPAGQLLLVDEAAAIPTPVLMRLVTHYPRSVFATTLHGYEGNGQGFALRFRQQLQRRFPALREFRLHTAIRWSSPDPLEQLVNRMLLLDVDASAIPAVSAPLLIESITQAELAADTSLLRQLFGLLVLAHYRTAPGDLRILLDSPNMRILVARKAGVPVGCVLLAEEGPLDTVLANAIWEGRRRPRGHLLPQTLIAQEGWREAAAWQGWRVVRIAAHPQLQQQGIGRSLLAAVEQAAYEQGVDYLGASFAGNEGLLRFWQDSGFVPVRLGDQRDPVAGTHALLVLKPLSSAPNAWLPQAREQFRRSVLHRLSGALQDLEAEQLPWLLQGIEPGARLSVDEQHRIEGFADAQRTLESSYLPLSRLLHLSIGRWHHLGISVADQRLLCARILRQQPPSAADEPAGKRAQLERLRVLVGHLLRQGVEE
ncbi:tRNA(Met) cytidine acetyltransferase TmcA [Marinobacterium weihaiense]|uniref:tRNA(Met) cytidine acetyltransferase TmcA n=1 Tax=Marinobacterium weihaiense TaxID=2851016 RepID=A0ABS6MAP6_9GAMM|nr:GNAT family N-acetyltransferase [Marinobacterium weihaiense]MBV0932822.1 GNAT family N-acetyltransferase [Marinobacterium weihaiense]